MTAVSATVENGLAAHGCTLAFESDAGPVRHLERDDHHRGCWLARADVVAWLRSLGVSRAELSNLGQGLLLARHRGWAYSVHVPWVLVSAMRWCPDPGEQLRISSRCPATTCRGSTVAWRCWGLPVELVRRDNALFYPWMQLPADLETMSIDRIVHHETP